MVKSRRSTRKPKNRDRHEIQPRSTLPAPIQRSLDRAGSRVLTAAEFQGLADVPPEVEWFANITNLRTRRAYRIDVTDFQNFVGIDRPEEFRQVTRAHVIAWRKSLEARELSPATIRRKLSALSSLFEH